MAAMLLKPSKFALRSSSFGSDNKQEDDGGDASKVAGDDASSSNFRNPFAKQLPETPKNVPEKTFVNPFLKTASSPSSASLKTASSPSSVTLKRATSPSSVSPSLLNNNTASKPSIVSQEKTIKLSNNTRSLDTLPPKAMLSSDLRNAKLYSKPILVPSSKPSNTIESSQAPNTNMNSMVALIDDEEVMKPERVVKQVVEFQAGGRRKETQRVVFKCKFCDSYFSDEVKANQHMKDVLVCDFPGCVINFHGKKELDQASHPYNVHRRSHATDRHRMQDSRQAAAVAKWMEKYARNNNSSFSRKPGQNEGRDKPIDLENSSNRYSLSLENSSNRSSSPSSESASEPTTFDKNLPLQKYLQKLLTVHPSLKVVQEKIVCSTCQEAKNVTEFARGVVIDRQIQKKVNEHFNEYSDKKSTAYLSSHFASLQMLENMRKKQANSGQNIMNRNPVGSPIDIVDSPIKASKGRARDEDDIIFNPKQKVAVSEKIMRKIERDPLLSKLEGFFEIKRNEVDKKQSQNDRMELIQRPMYNRQTISIGDGPMQVSQRSMQAKQIISIQDDSQRSRSIQTLQGLTDPSNLSRTTMRPEVSKRLLDVQNTNLEDGSNKKQKTLLINKDSSTSVIEMASQNQPSRRQIINNQIVTVQQNSQNKQVMYLSNSTRDRSKSEQLQQQQSERLQPQQAQRVQLQHQQSERLQQVQLQQQQSERLQPQQAQRVQFQNQHSERLQPQQSQRVQSERLQVQQSQRVELQQQDQRVQQQSQRVELQQQSQRVQQQSQGLQQSVARHQQPVYQIPIAAQNLSKGNGQQILDLDKLLAEGKIKGNQLVYTLET